MVDGLEIANANFECSYHVYTVKYALKLYTYAVIVINTRLATLECYHVLQKNIE